MRLVMLRVDKISLGVRVGIEMGKQEHRVAPDGKIKIKTRVG